LLRGVHNVHPDSDFFAGDNLLAGAHGEFLGAVIMLQNAIGVEKGERHPPFSRIWIRTPEPVGISRVSPKDGELFAD
jgi:hypothetical protein